MLRTNIYLSEPQKRRLDEIAKRLGIPVSEIIRRLIDEGLDRFEKKKGKAK